MHIVAMPYMGGGAMLASFAEEDTIYSSETIDSGTQVLLFEYLTIVAPSGSLTIEGKLRIEP